MLIQNSHSQHNDESAMLKEWWQKTGKKIENQIRAKPDDVIGIKLYSKRNQNSGHERKMLKRSTSNGSNKERRSINC